MYNSAKKSDRNLELIIKQHSDLVKIIASRYQNLPFENDDIYQEGMIGLLAAVKSYDDSKGASFKTYASHCINNSIQTALRKYKKQRDIPTEALTVFNDNEKLLKTSNLSAEDLYIANESVTLLTEEINKNLSSFENEVLKYYIDGDSYKNIAEKLNKPVKSIDNAVQRIRSKISKIVFEK